MNPIVPNPHPTPHITERSASIGPRSFGPTAVTAPPERRESSAPVPPQAPRPQRMLRWLTVGVLALASAGLFSLVRHRPEVKPSIVSGRAGPKHTKSGAAERWFRERVTVTLDDSLGQLSPAAQDAVEEAFGQWIGDSEKLPRIAFDSRPKAPVVLAPDGENRVYFAPITVPGHEKDLAITIGYTNTETGEITEADMIVNSKSRFALLQTKTETPSKSGSDEHGGSSKHGSGSSSGQTTQTVTTSSATTTVVVGCTNQFDFRSVVTHEAGHFFGLGEDMQDGSATMYYSTKPCDIGKRDLKATDASEVTELYASAPEDDAKGSAQKCSVGTLGERSGSGPVWIVVAMSLALTARRGRRARVA